MPHSTHLPLLVFLTFLPQKLNIPTFLTHLLFCFSHFLTLPLLVHCAFLVILSTMSAATHLPPRPISPHPIRARANTVTRKPHGFPTHLPRPSLPIATHIPRTHLTLASTDDDDTAATFLPSLPALQPHSLPEPSPTLHPDFSTKGDVILICPSGSEQLGFRLNSSQLRTTCDLFSTLGDPDFPLETDGRIYLDDPASDIYTFLTYLSSEHAVDYSLAQVFAISRLLTRFGAYPAIKLPLQGYIFRNAAALVASLGPSPKKEHVLTLLSVAVEFKSTEIWHWVISHVRCGWWRELLDPTGFSEAEEEVLGKSALNALRYIALFGEGSTWGEIETCAVARDNS